MKRLGGLKCKMYRILISGWVLSRNCRKGCTSFSVVSISVYFVVVVSLTNILLDDVNIVK